MSESNDQGLANLDEGKRDFLKKLAIGTAYAVPVIATFSLDSVRSKARAQSNYSEAMVVSLRAVPAAVAGDYLYGPSPSTFWGTEGQYYWVITYDRPMNPAYASAKICEVETFSGQYACDSPPPATDPVTAAACGTCGLAWVWSDDRTQELAPVAMVDTITTKPQRLTLWLNHANCPANTLYRDMDGTLLAPFVGVADLCQPPPD